MKYLSQHNSKVIKCKIREIVYKVDINTLEKQDAYDFKLNDIGRVVENCCWALNLEVVFCSRDVI